MISLLYLVILFYVLTPGIFITLPKGASKVTVAVTHGVIFAVIWKLTNAYVRRTFEGFRPGPPPPPPPLTPEQKAELARMAEAQRAAAAAAAEAARKKAAEEEARRGTEPGAPCLNGTCSSPYIRNLVCNTAMNRCIIRQGPGWDIGSRCLNGQCPGENLVCTKGDSYFGLGPKVDVCKLQVGAPCNRTGDCEGSDVGIECKYNTAVRRNPANPTGFVCTKPPPRR